MSRAGVSLRLRAGLTDKHAAILDTLEDGATRTSAEIADDTGYQEGELSTVLHTLAERGLLATRPARVVVSARGERRHACWAITDAGRTTLKAWETEVREDLADARPRRRSACGG